MARRRLRILLALLVLPFLILLGRLWSIQGSELHREELVTRALAQHVGVVSSSPRRGSIVDRNFEPLALNASSYRVVCIPQVLDPMPRVRRIRAICQELTRADARSKVTPEIVEELVVRESKKHLVHCRFNADECDALVPLINDVPSASVARIRYRVRAVFFMSESEDGSTGIVFDPHEAMRVELVLEQLAKLIPSWTADRLRERWIEIVAGIASDTKTEVDRYVQNNPGREKDRLSKLADVRTRRRSRIYALVPDVDLETVTAVEYAHATLPGIDIEDAATRVYPAGPSVGPFVGYLQNLTKAQLDKLRAENRLLHAFRDLDEFERDRVGMLPENAKVGASGIEREYDRALQGALGMRHFMKTPRSAVNGSDLKRVEPINGATVQTTIDLRLQQVLYSALESRVSQVGSPGGSAIVIELGDEPGAVLAAVGYPGYDAQRFREQAYRDQQNARFKDEWQRDRPFVQGVDPGSVFKIVSALALLEAGGVDPRRAFRCDGEPVYIGNRRYKCHDRDGHGSSSVDLPDALKFSCNNYFYRASSEIELEHIYAWAQALGYGRPATSAGSGSGTYAILRDPVARNLQRRSLGAYVIGQQFLTATPAQVVRMASAIALDGRGLPRLYRVLPLSMESLPRIRPSTIKSIQKGMEMVTQASGTLGKIEYQLRKFHFAAKTGTAQYQTGLRRWHGWVCGYGPLPNPKFAFAVCIEKSKFYGGETCAPVVRSMLEQLSKDYPELLEGGRKSPEGGSRR